MYSDCSTDISLSNDSEEMPQLMISETDMSNDSVDDQEDRLKEDLTQNRRVRRTNLFNTTRSTRNFEDESDSSRSDSQRTPTFRPLQSEANQYTPSNSARTSITSHPLSSGSQQSPYSQLTRTPTGRPLQSRAAHDEMRITNTGLKEMMENQQHIMQMIKYLRTEVKAMKTLLLKKVEEEEQHKLSVPARIRNAVKDAYASGTEVKLTWDYKKRFTDDSNNEMKKYIANSVKGLAPDVRADVLNAAMKRYFTTKKEAACREEKNKTEVHKKKQATYERKKEKVKRRLAALNKKSNWNSERKMKVSDLFKDTHALRYVSSDEDGDDGFITHPFSWESPELSAVKQSLDKKYLDICPMRSRRLLVKRQRGAPKEVEAPVIPNKFEWIVRPQNGDQ